MPDFKQILEQTLIVVGMRGAEIDPFGEARFSAEAKALNVQLDSAKTAVYQTDDASVLGNSTSSELPTGASVTAACTRTMKLSGTNV